MNSKKPEWCEKEPFKKTLCWVSDYVEKPTEGEMIEIIIGYDNVNSVFPFLFKNGRMICTLGYKYAIPLTKEEVLRYSLGE